MLKGIDYFEHVDPHQAFIIAHVGEQGTTTCALDDDISASRICSARSSSNWISVKVQLLA